MGKSFIDSIIRGYVEKPIYLWIPIIVTLLVMFVSYPLMLEWSFNEIATYSLLWFGVIFMVTGKYMTLRWGSVIEKEYEKTLRDPFEQKFIIPAKAWATINYEQQTNEPQKPKEISISANTKATIIIRTNSKLDLEVRDSQYSFGDDKKKKPKILKYKNPYYTKHTPWYDDDVFDWHGIYHLKGTRTMFKDVTYVDGFEIQTHDKGQYNFNMEFIVLCKQYGKLKEEKSKEVRTHLIVNVT
ncbi:MAG: hypothetical protein IMZ52_03350 [Actinobacteria bacterium]|nr:hypothetical protein [Actinomycetota bacterium]MBE3123149.1 hypothetical protein [Thermoplasmata archaeon]